MANLFNLQRNIKVEPIFYNHDKGSENMVVDLCSSPEASPVKKCESRNINFQIRKKVKLEQSDRNEKEGSEVIVDICSSPEASPGASLATQTQTQTPLRLHPARSRLFPPIEVPQVMLFSLVKESPMDVSRIKAQTEKRRKKDAIALEKHRKLKVKTCDRCKATFTGTKEAHMKSNNGFCRPVGWTGRMEKNEIDELNIIKKCLNCDFQSLNHQSVTNHIRKEHKKDPIKTASFHCPFGRYSAASKKYVAIHMFNHHQDRFNQKIEIKKSCNYKRCEFNAEFASEVREHVLGNKQVKPKHKLNLVNKERKLQYKDVYKCIFGCIQATGASLDRQRVHQTVSASHIKEHYMFRHRAHIKIDYSDSTEYNVCDETKLQPKKAKKKKKKMDLTRG